MLERTGKSQCVVILTALRVEYEAVCAYLKDLRPAVSQGTVYERGTFSSHGQSWEVYVVEIGAGGEGAAVETQRAINSFQAPFIFFVGIAGGFKDVAIGDVVVATKVYAYESGKATLAFEPRPEVWRSSYPL